MATPVSDTGCILICHYLKRNPKFTTRDEFWDYWQNVHGPKLVPLAEKYAFRRYQQLRTHGKVLPHQISPTAPATTTTAASSPEPMDFDGIATFLVPSMAVFEEALKDPYYLNYVVPDEYNLLDKEGKEGGVVASFAGAAVSVVQNGADVVSANIDLREEVRMAREAWKEWEIRGRKGEGVRAEG